MDEQELLRRCFERDRKAWDVFVEIYMPEIYKSVCRTIRYYGSGEDPNDMSHTAFLKLLDNDFKALKSFKFQSSLKTYVSVIAANETIRQLRKKTPKSLDASGLLSELEMRQEAERIEEVLPEAISKLEPRDRLVIKSFYEKGMSYNQLAKLLGVSHNTVGSVLARARERLKEIILRLGAQQ
jgi:RNA polymerase sigma-70 factor (ECF subfamily)